MLNTRLCGLLGIEHPVVLGGMAGGTTPDLVAAVSNAGGLGIQGVGSGRDLPTPAAALAERIRALTDRPFGLNMLLFMADDDAITATLAANPPVFSTAWPAPEQDLEAVFARAHAGGAHVLHMVATVHEAYRAAEAGADVIVAQGTEGGGHVGVMGTLPLVRMVVRAVAPLPVVAAGGIADGAGLAAALMLGAEGVLLGTRLLATLESPLHPAYRQAICDSDGHDTFLTEMPDVVVGATWPGAYVRVRRNRIMQEWSGREGEVRAHRVELAGRFRQAREQGDVDNGVLLMGQDAGLIDRVEPAADVVQRIVNEAEELLVGRAAGLVGERTTV
ncbi:MAG TPA: nitronate monooxygenase family protein [Chloroflexota bacterium]|jgi:NAD(P)H-dependent flavin oxidoreductase YrpB (nitropropane dioxygenase family)